MLNPSDIRHAVDSLGRDWILIPDSLARELRAFKRETWTEIYGVAAGYSADIPPGLLEDACAAIETFRLERGLPSWPFIAGEGHPFDARRPHGDYSLLVSTCGIDRSRNTGRFHFSG
jgi:hypothetical protein